MGKLTPYYERNGVTIHNGDCLEIMPQLDVTVDAIIADLPYGTTACSWDTVIPFEPLWLNYKRLIKDNGAVVLFGSEPFSSKLRLSNLDWYKYDWVWDKSGYANFAQVPNMPAMIHENVIVFSCGGVAQNSTCRMVFNHQGARIINEKKEYDYRANSFIPNRTNKRRYSVQYAENYDKSIIRIKGLNGLTFANGRLHPTQKPVELMQYLIRTYTNPGELILDNTAGSGTTLLAAQNEGRRAIGIELSLDYCRIAVDRLKQPSFFSIPDKPKVEKPEQLKLIGE